MNGLAILFGLSTRLFISNHPKAMSKQRSRIYLKTPAVLEAFGSTEEEKRELTEEEKKENLL